MINQLNNNKNAVAGSAFEPEPLKRQVSKFNQLLSMLPIFTPVKPVIAIIRLSGVIGKTGGFKSGLTIESLNELIEKAFEIKKLTAVCLIINSPGGSPVQSELIAARIRSLAEEKKVKVYSFVEDVAASGGYWLACAGEQIYACTSSIIGSIGVVSSGFGFHSAINKLGIERRVYSQGKNKSVLDPFKPEQEGDVEIVRRIQKQIHDHFIDYVKERRAGKLTQSDDILFNGEFWTGQTALDYGLIDGIDNIYDVIKKKFGEDVSFEYIANKQSWFKKKLGLIDHQSAQDFSQTLVDSLIDSVETKIMYNKFDMK